jgi:hypothetical protein
MIKEDNFIFNNVDIILEEENIKIKKHFKKQKKDNYQCFYPLSITNEFLFKLNSKINDYIIKLGEDRLLDFHLAKEFYIQNIKNNIFNYNEYDTKNLLITNRIFNYILFLDPGKIKFINLNHTENVLKNSLLIFPEEYTHNFEFVNSKDIVILNGFVNFI